MSKKDLENQIKQNLIQKDKEVIIDLYLQMKYERDINSEQLESTKKLHECERFYLVNQAKQFDEMSKNNTKQLCERIKSFIIDRRLELRNRFSEYGKGKDNAYFEIEEFLKHIESGGEK